MQFRPGNAKGPGSSKDLMRLGLSNASRPVDQLVELLERLDPASWLANTLGGLDSLRDAAPFPGSGHPLEQLQALKEESKRSGATAGYFVAVAAALVEHGERISSAPPAELRATFLDLASVTTDEWQEFWTGAARTLEQDA